MPNDSERDQARPQAGADELELTFEELRSARASLVELTRFHAQSVMWFKHESRPWFCLTSEEKIRGPSMLPLRHLTTSASCIESMHTVPDYRDRPNVVALTAKFAGAAFANLGKWESDGAARVYCRVRTLPVLLRLAPEDVLVKNLSRILELITFAWNRVDPTDSRFQGLSEAPDREPDPEAPTEKEKEAVGEWRGYPANAFHTFWGIKTLNEFVARQLGGLPATIEGSRPIAELWARRTLAVQTALVPTEAERVDAHQLAWSLAAEFASSTPPALTESNERVELYKAGLRSFFGDQQPSGAWRLYQPLFHYPQAGNAYCYTFETLTHLLLPALDVSRGRVLRELLRPYAPNLLRAAEFASRTVISLPNEENLVGWCSGHHPHRLVPEAWATASVFSFLQCLRRLIGVWTAELAESDLGVRQPAQVGEQPFLKTLKERGDTWTSPYEWTLGREISGLFVIPMQMTQSELGMEKELDPDRPLAVDEQARSAILFGPPGTSKTTVVEALAGVIGWRYVEIHASDFLSEGMDRVPRRADAIFSRLMELDHCVILFDEIDGLLVKRDLTVSEDARASAGHTDPFEKFLTTSMLPKIAQLWKQRRVLFFVATNDIAGADPAIKRSQRFDAAVFAAPPSWHVKEGLIRKKIGRKLPRWLTWERVLEELENETFEPGSELGLVALLRWDQITELVDLARDLSTGSRLTEAGIREALRRVADGVAEDWSCSPDKLFRVFREFRRYRRRDYNRLRVALAIGGTNTFPTAFEPLQQTTAGTYLQLRGGVESRVDVGRDGSWTVATPGGTWVDDGLLIFSSDEPSD